MCWLQSVKETFQQWFLAHNYPTYMYFLSFWTVVLEKTLESPLDHKEIQPVHPEGYQSWVFIGRTEAEAETPILWLPHSKSWLIGKDLMLGGIGGRRRRGRQRMRWLMASPTQWTWVWVNSGSWWWTGRPGVLRFMELQRVGHDWSKLAQSNFGRGADLQSRTSGSAGPGNWRVGQLGSKPQRTLMDFESPALQEGTWVNAEPGPHCVQLHPARNPDWEPWKVPGPQHPSREYGRQGYGHRA